VPCAIFVSPLYTSCISTSGPGPLFGNVLCVVKHSGRWIKLEYVGSSREQVFLEESGSEAAIHCGLPTTFSVL